MRNAHEVDEIFHDRIFRRVASCHPFIIPWIGKICIDPFSQPVTTIPHDSIKLHKFEIRRLENFSWKAQVTTSVTLSKR